MMKIKIILAMTVTYALMTLKMILMEMVSAAVMEIPSVMIIRMILMEMD